MLDSSFLIAWLNERDAHHKAAAACMRRLAGGEWGPALLPEYVFLETVTVIATRRDLTFAQDKAKEILEARESEFVPCSPHFASTLDFFRTQRRTKLSFADCSIVAVAKDRNAGSVATFDREFQKVDGLEVVPR